MRDRRLELAALLVVTVLGAFAALTRNPEGVVVERAKEWPLVGSWAARFQARFRAPPAPAPPRPARPPVVIVYRDSSPPPAAGPAAPEAPAVGATRAAPVPSEPSGPIDRTPLSPGPLESVPAAAEPLARAVALLGAEARETTIGPYALHADFDPPERWSALADALDFAFAVRVGVAPLGTARETVVAFAERAGYRALQRLEPRLAGLEEAAGHAAGGLAVLVAEAPASDAAEATLVHELVHFVARRAIGPALPAWLAEGLAEDLAWSRFDDDAGFRLGSLRDGIRPDGEGLSLSGAAAGLEDLANALPAGGTPRLAALVELDDHDFAAGPAAPLRYAQALWWVRFLLDGEAERAEALRRYLAGVAAGGAADRAALERELGATLDELEPGFRSYVADRRAELVDARLVELAGPGRRVVLGARRLGPAAP